MGRRRKSTMEALRILSMLLVLLVHATFMATGLPDGGLLHDRPLVGFALYLQAALSVVCVNVFVLLSGWYGIHWHPKRLGGLMFQVLFFALLVYLALVIAGPSRYLYLDDMATILMIHSSDYWFVKSYIILFILSPALNLFIERVSRHQLLLTLVAFYLFQTVYGWLSIDGAVELAGGYSALSFMGLYMLSQYVRRYVYGEAEFQAKAHKSRAFMALYLGICLVHAVTAFCVTRMGFPVAGRIFTYTNPLVIVESLCLLLAFATMKPTYSRLVNWIAASSLAVYLLHADELVLRPYYAHYIGLVFHQHSYPVYLACVVGIIVVVYLSALLLDQVRKFVWNKIATLAWRQ